ERSPDRFRRAGAAVLYGSGSRRRAARPSLHARTTGEEGPLPRRARHDGKPPSLPGRGDRGAGTPEDQQMMEKRVLKDGSVRWKARIKNGGAVVAQQTFRLKGDAETWEREQMRAIQLGTFLPPQKAKTPLGEVVASFLAARTSQVSAHSHRTDRDNLAALPARLKARPIGSVSEADVLGFLTDQLKIKERSTVARTRTTLSALFT